jgi:predicted DNA-binding transcriptional regulator AlpA/DNA-binding TFAR19-related protein (PDSD5 family)
MPKELLSSWKEISAYTGYSERTVQRWERTLGLPVRRPAGKARSAVVSLTSEIDAWFRSAPMLEELRSKSLNSHGEPLRARYARSNRPGQNVAGRPPKKERRSRVVLVETLDPNLIPTAHTLLSQCKSLAEQCAQRVETLMSTLQQSAAIRRNIDRLHGTLSHPTSRRLTSHRKSAIR